jgi:hypothetical protein
MGIIKILKDAGPAVPFTEKDLMNRELVIRMLKYEDSLILGEEGKAIYADPSYEMTKSIFAELVFHRMTLTEFGYQTDDTSVAIYRSIPMTYWKSPTEYDAEVMNSVAYTRANRCLYYTAPEIKVGDTLPDCRLYDLDGKETTIRESLGGFDMAFVAAFSTS